MGTSYRKVRGPKARGHWEESARGVVAGRVTQSPRVALVSTLAVRMRRRGVGAATGSLAVSLVGQKQHCDGA